MTFGKVKSIRNKYCFVKRIVMREIYFAQIREDGRAERELTTRLGARRIACIGSGGCTRAGNGQDHLRAGAPPMSGQVTCAAGIDAGR